MLMLVGGVLVLGCAGAAAGIAGAEMPHQAGAVLSSAGDVLGWVRLLVVAVLAFRVLRLRED